MTATDTTTTAADVVATLAITPGMASNLRRALRRLDTGALPLDEADAVHRLLDALPIAPKTARPRASREARQRRETRAHTFRCTTCGAPAFAACVTPEGTPADTHPARLYARNDLT